MSYFDRWAIIRSGFTQHRGSGKSNGCIDLAGVLASRYGGNGNRIEIEAWDDCPEHTARYVNDLSTWREPPVVAVFAYSWGCGYGAVRLARALRAYNIKVRYAVLCDPVYYGMAKWRALIPRGLFSRVRIAIPSNVQDVLWLRQHVSKPAGHDLSAESSCTTIHPPVVLDRVHSEMDNSPQFQMLCLEAAAKLFGGSR